MIIFIIILLCSQTEIPLEIKQLQREIQIINLVNGLELSSHQIACILDMAQETENMRNEFHKEIDKNKKVFIEVLNQLKENNLANKDISAELGRNVHIIETRAQELRSQYIESLERMSREVEAILDPHQLYQLEHYIPCLITPPGESKIGQSENPAGIIKQLARIRQMPGWLYEARKYDIVEKTVQKIKHHMPKNVEFDAKNEQKRILVLFDELRSVSDIDFALNKENYVERLKGEYLVKEIPLNLSFKIEKFLLDPLVIPILEEKTRVDQ